MANGDIDRRGFLRAGAAAALAGAAQAAPRAAGFGSAKRCILLCLWGSPSQLETFDPKPDAPRQIRGDLGAIPTALPGIRISEILPRIARILDRVCVVRSMTHRYPIHGWSYAATGVPATDIPLELNSRDPRQWPFIGSVVEHLGKPGALPGNLALPFLFGSRRGPSRGGPFGGFLGPAFDPVWTDFRATGTRTVERDANAPGIPPKMVADPYLGILPGDRFEASRPAPGLTLDRIRARAGLSGQLDGARRWIDEGGASGAFARHQRTALSVLSSGKLARALDVQAEPAKLRERYGMTLFGQSCLAARRILEGGGKFVSVFWDEYGLVNTGWDTHIHHYPRLKNELGPGLDAAFTALLMDLEARGLLEGTAIAVMSEHGRTPRLQNVKGGGRDHWSLAYSSLFAGAGFARGRVVGRTDREAGRVTETPVSPKDVLATLYHLLGIDPATEIRDRLGRPYAVGGSGKVRSELLA